MEATPVSGPKRSDVGYKRPPPEHQFKEGQKPPPRKRKVEKKMESSRQLLSRLLNEPRRVLIDGKPVWRSTADLLVYKAYEAAERGNHTLRRLLSELHFAVEPPGEVPPNTTFAILEPDGTFTPLPAAKDEDCDE